MNSSYATRQKVALSQDAVASERSRELARSLAARSKRAKSVPIRVSFVRDSADQGNAPMARLISRGGRGGGVALKLLIALIWASAAEPFDTAISGRMWASLLDLPDPGTRGARRIADALRALESERLIRTVPEPGKPPRVYLRDEDGRGADYSLPATSWARASTDDKPSHIYFPLPVALWTEGHLQHLSAAAVGMLLICLSNPGAAEGKPLWWSTRIFNQQYGISPATRARGTRELVERGLLKVTKQLVVDSPQHWEFSREQVRNLYHLRAAATLSQQKAVSEAAAPSHELARSPFPNPFAKAAPINNTWPPQGGTSDGSDTDLF